MDKTEKRAMILMIVTLVFLLNYGFLISGTIPQKIGEMAAMNYVQKNYAEKILIFEKIEFSSAHGNYIAVFTDYKGEPYNFLMTSKLWPTSILYDPFLPPGP